MSNPKIYGVRFIENDIYIWMDDNQQILNDIVIEYNKEKFIYYTSGDLFYGDISIQPSDIKLKQDIFVFRNWKYKGMVIKDSATHKLIFDYINMQWKLERLEF